MIEEVLKKQPSPRADKGGCWQRGLDYLRFDGDTSTEDRDQMIKSFNMATLRLRLFLISTKAGGQGLNLAAASRVIIFDASWNPSNDMQAVYRAYRYGQTRPVHVYRLIAEGFEQCMYRQQVAPAASRPPPWHSRGSRCDRPCDRHRDCQQVVKLQLAGRVVDEQSLEATYTEAELKDLWKQVDLRPPVHAGCGAAAGSFPPDSWLHKIATSREAESWMMQVEDHNLKLEDSAEQLSSREQEDARNELQHDDNNMPREGVTCGNPSCGALQHSNISFSTLEFCCQSCQTVTLLPPATPLVQRLNCEAGHLMFKMHNEDSESVSGHLRSTILREGGFYHLQWREVEPGVEIGDDDKWVDPKKPMRRGSLISKRKLSHTKQYQARTHDDTAARRDRDATAVSTSSPPLPPPPRPALPPPPPLATTLDPPSPISAGTHPSTARRVPVRPRARGPVDELPPVCGPRRVLVDPLLAAIGSRHARCAPRVCRAAGATSHHHCCPPHDRPRRQRPRRQRRRCRQRRRRHCRRQRRRHHRRQRRRRCCPSHDHRRRCCPSHDRRRRQRRRRHYYGHRRCRRRRRECRKQRSSRYCRWRRRPGRGCQEAEGTARYAGGARPKRWASPGTARLDRDELLRRRRGRCRGRRGEAGRSSASSPSERVAAMSSSPSSSHGSWKEVSASYAVRKRVGVPSRRTYR